MITACQQDREDRRARLAELLIAYYLPEGRPAHERASFGRWSNRVHVDDARNARTAVEVLHSAHVTFGHGKRDGGTSGSARGIALLILHVIARGRIETVRAAI